MAFQFSDLWRFDGRVSRAKYAAAGFIGVAIKHNLDRLIAASFLGYKTSFFNYWAPLGKAARLDHLSSTEAKFLATLLLTSIPFLWVMIPAQATEPPPHPRAALAAATRIAS